MKKVLLAEEPFYSLQGEGQRIGTPSVFVRSFGCTLRCPGFGLAKECICSRNKEVDSIIQRHKEKPYTNISEMPLAATGCDSYPAIYPEFRELSQLYTVEDVVTKFQTLGDGRSIDLVITGGEPLLYQTYWVDVIERLWDIQGDVKTHITFETNGTLKIEDRLSKVIEANPNLFTLSISPKLSCAGNPVEQAWKPEAISSLISQICNVYLKFVVGQLEDVNEIDSFLAYVNMQPGVVPIYLMPVGGTRTADTQVTSVNVADICLKKNYLFTDRLHLSLWGNEWSL